MTLKKSNPFTRISLLWNLETLFQDISKLKGSPLTLFEETCICGLLSGYPPTRISDEIYCNPNSLKVEMSRRIYPYISDLTGEDNVSWNSVVTLLRDYKHPELKVLDQRLLSIPFPQNTKKSHWLTATIEEFQKTQRELKDSDVQLVKKYVVEGQSLTSTDPDSAIKLFLKALEIHAFQVAAIVNIIHCYDKLEQYYNSFALCDLVLWMLDCDVELTMENLSEDEKHRIQQNYYSQIYIYLGSAMHKIATEDKNCSHLKIAHDFYHNALYHSPYDVIASSNTVNLHIMATKNDSLSFDEIQKHYNLAEIAMEALLTIASSPKSNFERYKASVIEQATDYCSGLGFAGQQYLEKLKSLSLKQS